MKVIKVLVDEMPESCKECIYPNWNSLGDRYCQAALRIIYDDKKRPDWCPLVVGDRLLFEHSIMKRWIEGESESE